MNDIKDYLHLYLGCQMKLPDGSIQNLHGIIEDEKGIWFQFSPKLYYTLLIKYALPILRPLSSMTEDEKKELEDDIMHRHWATDLKYQAVRTKWYLSKHFDLFGLIEAGLAIDATTLK